MKPVRFFYGNSFSRCAKDPTCSSPCCVRRRLSRNRKAIVRSDTGCGWVHAGIRKSLAEHGVRADIVYISLENEVAEPVLAEHILFLLCLFFFCRFTVSRFTLPSITRESASWSRSGAPWATRTLSPTWWPTPS